jgi:hypothetical protein
VLYAVLEDWLSDEGVDGVGERVMALRAAMQTELDL